MVEEGTAAGSSGAWSGVLGGCGWGGGGVVEEGAAAGSCGRADAVRGWRWGMGEMGEVDGGAVVEEVVKQSFGQHGKWMG